MYRGANIWGSKKVFKKMKKAYLRYLLGVLPYQCTMYIKKKNIKKI